MLAFKVLMPAWCEMVGAAQLKGPLKAVNA
jgi:hypothetical protein